jgi:hypothetical protein
VLGELARKWVAASICLDFSCLVLCTKTKNEVWLGAKPGKAPGKSTKNNQLAGDKKNITRRFTEKSQLVPLRREIAKAREPFSRKLILFIST